MVLSAPFQRQRRALRMREGNLRRALLVGFAWLAFAAAPAAAPCAGIVDEDARLNCLAQQAKAGAPAPAPQLSADGAVQSTIVSVSRRRGGEMVFRLANGQAWMQQRAGFMLANPGERVIIAPARFGGDILTTERSAATRVRRIE